MESPHFAVIPGGAEKPKRVRAWKSPSRVNELDAIAKWILNMTAAESGNVVHFRNFHCRLGQAHQESCVVTATQGGMRLLRGAKILLHAEMNLHFTTFEPASSTLSEFRWLGNLGHAKQIAVKPASRIFPARRHGKLDMIDRKERPSDHVGVLSLILYRTPEVRGPASALLESNVDRRTHGRRLPSQFCDHCPHRSRQIHSGGPPAGVDRIADRARDAGPGARLHGPGAGARHHYQGPRRPYDVHRAGRPALPAQPYRHAGPRGFFLRSLALTGVLRRRWPPPIWPSTTVSRLFRSSTRLTCPAPMSSAPRR